MKKIISRSINDFFEFIEDNSNGYDVYMPWEEDDIDELDFILEKEFPKEHPLSGGAIYYCTDYSVLCLYINNKLVGLCSALIYDEEDGSSTTELYTLVEAKLNRHHIGFELIAEAAASFYTDNIYLVGSNESFADRVGATFSHCEHFMEREASDQIEGINNKLTFSEASTLDENEDEEGEDIGTLWQACLDDNIVSSLRVDDFDDYINISLVHTEPAMRHMGYAYSLMSHVLNQYNKPCLLQVSGCNENAVKLYIKLGFNFIHTIDYYKLIP